MEKEKELIKEKSFFKEKEVELNKENSFSIIELILIFLRNRNKIILVSLVFLLISIIFYFFIFDLIYFSTATIKSSPKTSGLLGALESGLPDIGGLDGIGFGVQSSKELAAYEEILISRRCLEDVINHFRLMERDEYQFMEDAIKDFRSEKLKLNPDKLAGVLHVGVYDKDPALAKEMVDYLLERLDKINIELNVLNAKNNKEFIENRYYQARLDLKNTEDSLKNFQILYGLSPELQFKAAAQTQFTLEAELKSEEVKLDILKQILAPDQIEVKTQEAKINSLRSEISKIQNSTNLNDFLRLGNSPEILQSFLRYQREVEIQSKIVSFLLPIYEQAKIEEKRETPTILVLDKPYIAERKSKPKRLTMVIIWTFIGLFTGYAFFIVKDKWESYTKTNQFSWKNKF